MKLNVGQKISIWYMSFMLAFWLALVFTHTTSGTYNYTFSFLMSLLPFLGGLVAMWNSKGWKGMKGFVNKGIFFLGLGIFCWGSGELIWSYYNFFMSVPAPYPSLADLGFAPSVLFYCIGVVYLARAAGADFGLRRKSTKFFAVVVPIVMFFVSYYFLVTVARQGVLVTSGDPIIKTILDIAYPLGDFVSLTLAIVISGLSFKFLIKEYKYAIFSILAGIAVMFFADLIFSYTTTIGTYFNADFGDLIFTASLFLLTFGLLGFCGSRENNQEQGLHVFKFLWYS